MYSKHEALERRPCAIGSVLVIDDHPLYGAALESALRHVFEGCEIVTATTLGEGIKALARDFRPDMVLLDLKLPDVTGISGFLRLREGLPDVPVVVISSLTSDEVIQADVDEALRLMRMSKVSLLDDAGRGKGRGSSDPISDIYGIIRDHAVRTGSQEVAFQKAQQLIQPRGFRDEQLRACLEEYAALNVWSLDDTMNVYFGEDDLPS